MIDLSIRRPVATAAIYIGLFALGAFSFRLIPVELLPEVAYPKLTVSASWAGASPEALEAFVTAPIESAIQQVRGVRKVISTSRVDQRGMGSNASIEIEFERDTRMEFARLDMGERIAALSDELPPGVYPSVEPFVPPEFEEEDQPFLSYRLTGPYTFGELGRLGDEEIVPTLRAIDGVADAQVYGGEQREIAIELDRERLEALNLRPEDVRARIEEVSAPRAPGSVTLDGRTVALAVRTRAFAVAELGDIVVLARPEGAIRVRDLGRVRDQTADPRLMVRIDGLPTVQLVIRRQTGTNAVRLADRLKGHLSERAAELPPGVELELLDDQSEDIRTQLSDLRLRAIAAAIVIFLVLMLFLRSLSAVAVVFATIGFSVLFAVNLLYLGGFSLNVLSLAGLAWGFGLVVDNGIVVFENVDRHHGQGASTRDAALRGARQVALPVVASTLTTAIVLVPFLFLQGDLRAYYLPLAFAVGFSILASLFVAFTFVPSLAARLGGRVRPPVVDTASQHLHEPFYIQGYRTALGWALRHPVMVGLVCGGCLAGSFLLFDKNVTRGVPWTSFWGQRTYILITIQFPRGAGIDRTDELARAFEAKLATLPEPERYVTVVQDQYARIEVTFPEELEDSPVPPAIKEQMVAYSYGFSGVEVRVYGYGPSFYGGGGSPPNYRLKVLGYNYLTVRDIAGEIAGRLERFGRIQDVDPNASGSWFERDKEFEFTIAPNRSALESHDLSVEQLLSFVSANVRTEFSGNQLRIGGDEVPYAVKVAGYRDFDLQNLRELRIPVESGADLRLIDVASVEQRDVLANIRREDQQYERTVAWEFRGPIKLGDLVRDAVVDAMELPPGYRVEEDESWRWSEEERVQVYLVLGFAILLIYMVTAGLFESLAAPFVVLLTLPLALIGVFLIFFLADATFTRTAYIGTIMMAGIVVNNAILIVYHIGELRRHMEIRAAILQGTLERVRPIFMTTLTTVFGLLPLVVFAGGQDSNIWNALALATIGGLISSTIFVLVAIPVAYRWIVARGA
jgi:HAE1 family hydrophobic/amphiphilic exporter-1